MKSDAEVLADVFRQLREQGSQNLQWWWAIPPKPVKQGMLAVNSRLLIAISAAVGGADSHVKRRVYATAYHNVIPKVRVAAENAAVKALQERFADLRRLESRLSQPGIAKRIHTIAVRTYQRLGGFAATDTDYENAKSVLGRPPRTEPTESHVDFSEQWRKDRAMRNDPQFDSVEAASLRSRMGAAMAKELSLEVTARKDDLIASEVDTLCRVLYLHPFFIQILSSYATSHTDGDRYTRALVIDAMAKTLEFQKELLAPTNLPGEPYHIWRYPPLVRLGIKDLGLDKVDGFSEYMIALLPALSHNLLESALFAMGWVLMAVSLGAAIPLGAAVAAAGAAGVGAAGATGALAGLALADFAMALPPVALSYLEEREQDLAGISSDFSATRFAQRQSYWRTTLSATAALLSGLMLTASGSQFLKALRAAKKAPPPVPPAARTRQQPDFNGVSHNARFNDKSKRMTNRDPGRPNWAQRPAPEPAPPARAAGGGVAPQAVPVPADQPRPAMPGRRADELAPVASGTPGGGGGAPPAGIGSAASAATGVAGKGTGAGSAGTGSPATGSSGKGSTATGGKATGGTGVGPAAAAAPRVFVRNSVKFTVPPNLPVDTNVVGTGITAIKVEVDARNRVITTIEGWIRPKIPRQHFEEAIGLASQVPGLEGLPCDRLHLWPSFWGDEAGAGVLHGSPNFNRGRMETLERQLNNLSSGLGPDRALAVRAQARSFPRDQLGGNAANLYRYDFMVVNMKTGTVEMRHGVIFRTDPRLAEFDIEVFPEGLTW